MSNIGLKIKPNYCYSASRVEAEGYDWLVIREIGDHRQMKAEILTFETTQDKESTLKEWTTKP
jgi:hypothetical protein